MIAKLKAALGRFFYARNPDANYKTYTIPAAYLCEGEISEIRRIWTAEGWGL
jgi:hypothetical protein